MKKRMTIYLIVLILGVWAYLRFAPVKPTWSPYYCSQFSGFQPLVLEDREDCDRAVCKVVRLYTVDRDTGTTDGGGYFFKCVRK